MDLELRDWDHLGADVGCLVNLQPAGNYLMEDFYYAGGLPVVLRELLQAGVLHGDVRTVNGKTMRENVHAAEN